MKKPLGAFELSPTSPISGINHWMTSDTYEANLELWAAAVEQFVKGEWGDANDQFDGLFADDLAAKCFVRFMKRTNGVPPKDWAGAFTPRPEE